MSPLFSREAADGASERDTSLRLFRKGARASHGLPSDVPSAGWRCHVFGILGICVLITHNPAARDCRTGGYHDVKKQNTSVKFSTRKRLPLRCPFGEIHSVRYSQ